MNTSSVDSFQILTQVQNGTAVAKKLEQERKEATTLSTIRGLGKFDFLGRVFMSVENYFRMQSPIVLHNLSKKFFLKVNRNL